MDFKRFCKKKLAELAIITIFWSVNLCLHSMCGAKSAWLPSMYGVKSALLPSMCGAKSANLLRTWMGAMQTLLRTWKGAMQILLRTWSRDIVSGTQKMLTLQFSTNFQKRFFKTNFILDGPSRNNQWTFATGKISQNIKFAAFWCFFLTRKKVDPESW